MGLTRHQKQLQREGLQELDLLRVLTTVKYWGGLVAMAVSGIFVLFWTYIYYVGGITLTGVPSWVFWVVSLVPAIIFFIGLWSWYLAKSLREFKMWAYDWYTYQTAFGAVSQGIGSIMKFSQRDWKGGLQGVANTAIKGGIVAYLLKKDVRNTYTRYSNMIWGHTPSRATATVGVQADFRFNADTFKDYWTVMDSGWLTVGLAIGFSVVFLATSLLVNGAGASTETFVGHGSLTVFWSAVFVALVHRYFGKCWDRVFPAFVGTLLIGLVGVLLVSVVTELWFELGMVAFLSIFSMWLVVQHIGSHLYFCKRV